MLNSVNDLHTNITKIPDDENWTDSSVNVMVEFKFDQHSGIISELKLITKDDSQNEREE